MKKTLRMLCMGVLAAVSAVTFAQENVTNKLLNPDAEKGMLGWDVTFVDGGFIWNKQTKGEGKAVGYHGFNNWAFENWRGSGSLGASSVYQVVSDLPNGTYVFGAYAMATNDSWEPSIENIQGVSIFANADSIAVATHRVEGMNEKWAHSIKFNVATIVEDGTLKVGMSTAVGCNTNFVAMDNATLYFFGDKTAEEALEEMAKIDMAATIAKVDTFLKYKMNVDTVQWINDAIAAAADVSAETAAQVDEDLWWGKRQAVKSIAQYEALANAIAAAKVVAEAEWSEYVADAVAALNETIAAAEEMYDEATAEKQELADAVTALKLAAALVEIDGCYILLENYTDSVDALEIGEDLGQFTELQQKKAKELLEYVELALSEAEAGEKSPIDAKAECEGYFAQIHVIINSPIDYAEFPIFLGKASKPLPNQKPNKEGNPTWAVLDGAYETNLGGYNNLIEYKSQLYRFREPLKSVRFYIRAVGDPSEVDKNKNPHICISGFAMFDELGDPIPLTVDNVVSNATENEGQGIPGMLDYNPSTFFHSLWRTGTPEAHYIEVTLPEGEYSAFSFKMLSYGDTRSRVFPAELEITYVSPMVTELQKLLVTARNLNPLFGTGVGFVNYDPAVYNAALAEADAVVAKKGATDEEALAAINKLYAVYEEIVAVGIKMPEAGKKYRIISGEPRFFTNQNIMKGLTLHTDTIYGDWLWWETAHPDSARQEFILEPYSTHGDRAYYTIQHAQTGLYLGEIRDSLGNLKEQNRFIFTERVDSFWLKSLGQGQFGIMASDGNSRKQFNMEFHNNGAWSDQVKNYGAIAGVKSYIHTWDSGANASSAWFFREMVQLPQALKSISDLNFRSEAISIYEGVNNMTLTADKECAFADLTICDVFGNKVAIDAISVEGNVATLVLSKSVETFFITFTNAEGVAEVSVDGFYVNNGPSKAFTALQTKYNTVLALAPVEGNDVGQVSDLSEYNDALAIAEGLLAEGAEDAELELAAAALDSAQAHLSYNLPKADVDYLILLGLDAIRNNHLTDMAVFADRNTLFNEKVSLRWTYVSLTNPEYRWRFIDCGELKWGRHAYYIQSAVTEGYVTRTVDSGANIFLSEDSTATRPYDIFFKTNGKVALTDTHWSAGDAALHPNSHGSGAAGNKGNRMITWGQHDAASAMYVVEADKYIQHVLWELTEIENIDVTNDYVAPAVKGTFDLFGRRIETPATTGIYIVDGKKRVIKK